MSGTEQAPAAPRPLPVTPEVASLLVVSRSRRRALTSRVLLPGGPFPQHRRRSQCRPDLLKRQRCAGKRLGLHARPGNTVSDADMDVRRCQRDSVSRSRVPTSDAPVRSSLTAPGYARLLTNAPVRRCPVLISRIRSVDSSSGSVVGGGLSPLRCNSQYPCTPDAMSDPDSGVFRYALNSITGTIPPFVLASAM
eukprot:2560217-Rhodomonas_salina.1